MAYRDLRHWIETLEKEGELGRVKARVDWNLEIGGITQAVFDKGGPALLFENIKDHESTLCRKLFTGSLGTYGRIALMMGLSKDTPLKEVIKTYMQRIKEPIKPRLVNTGPVKEVILKGDQVDLFQFPAPRWHDRDGGRFIGTCDGVVTKDPETGWMNVGLYRRQIHDRNHTGLTVIHGQHNWLHWRRYRERGHKTLPIAMINGWDPVLPFTASAPLPAGVCEYDIMGALRGEPVELVKCETIDLEVPASAEIVIEGELSLDFDSFRPEGPFGEFHGYYASLESKKPVVTWKCITCRKDPVLQGTLEGVPINESDRMLATTVSALYWDHLNEHVPGVKAVYLEPSGSTAIVQVDNSYLGQPYQVASAIWSLSFSGQLGKNVMVVDEDIDIFDPDKLFWALGTRVSPLRDVIMVPGVTLVTDPSIHPRDRVGGAGGTTLQTTRLLIDATKYFGNPRTEAWFGEKFAPVCYPDDETMKLVRQRWAEYGIK
ncbi:MAG: UbiD family decarboxylase [Chloroflexi bacterium]|nr:UbiD family decarboxylase [Chloroflexota bacterium]